MVEMDTLIGRIGGKAILTLHFPKSNFMLGILLENKDTSNVSKAILALKEKLKAFGLSFGEIFCVLLTDNGSEFADIFSIENDLDGERETRLFFCDPNQPNQKPHIEKNHTLFRDIVPKGESFDELTQEKINLIFSHLNSIRRKEFNGKSAYDMFTFMYDETLATILEIQRIEDTDVVQSPKLLMVNRG